MPNPTEVVIIKRDGSITPYTTYGSARASAVSGDLIQIRADLNEQILLKNLVDIWIMPGVVIDFVAVSPTPQGPTITDNNTAVTCNIYGMGIIKNTDTTTNGRYECIKLSNASSKLSVECDYIEGVGGFTYITSPPNPRIEFYGYSVTVSASKFHLTCRSVISKKSLAILISSASDLNLNIESVETGLDGTINSDNYNTGSTALITYGTGFIKINKILCRNVGHCLSVRGGSVIARIKNIKSQMNFIPPTPIQSPSISAVHVSQGSGTQKLVLYFDEISSLTGRVNSLAGIEVAQGTAIFIGRKIYSDNTLAVQIAGATTKGFLKCNEVIVNDGTAIVLNDFNDQFLIDSNYIEGNSGAVIFSGGTNLASGNFFIRNAKIINKSNSSSARGIFLQNIYPKIALNNVKIISGTDDGSNIFLNSGTSINVFNYGIFLNEGIDQSKVVLKVGVGTSISDPGYNYQCIVSSLLT